MTYPNIEGLTYKDFPTLTCPAGDSWADHESGTGTGECFDQPHTCQMAATVLDCEERQEREGRATNERTRTMDDEDFINENWSSGASEDDEEEDEE